MEKKGRPKIENPKTEVLQLRLTGDEKSLIKYMANVNGNVSMAEFIMELVLEEYTRWKIVNEKLEFIEF